MAKALTKAQQNAKLVELVGFYAANPNAVMYTAPNEHTGLIAAGMVEINTGMVDAQGNIATRPTAQGIAAVNSSTTSNAGDAGSPAAPSQPVAKPSFEIQQAALPAVSGRGRGAGTETYPFDKLEVGYSFFVPNSTDKPNPAKSLASTVSSATKRYAEVVPGETVKNKKGADVPKTKETRKFVVRSRTAAQEQAEGFAPQDGARVYRTA